MSTEPAQGRPHRRGARHGFFLPTIKGRGLGRALRARAELAGLFIEDKRRALPDSHLRANSAKPGRMLPGAASDLPDI